MTATAFRLRKEDAKKNTQKRVAMLLGVDQSTVSRWWPKKKTRTTNMQTHNGGNGEPSDTDEPDPPPKGRTFWTMES